MGSLFSNPKWSLPSQGLQAKARDPGFHAGTAFSIFHQDLTAKIAEKGIAAWTLLVSSLFGILLDPKHTSHLGYDVVDNKTCEINLQD